MVKTLKGNISLLKTFSKSDFLFETIRSRNKNILRCLRGCITCHWNIWIVSLVTKKIKPAEGQRELFSVDPPVKMRAIVYVRTPCRHLIPKGLFANIFIQRKAPFSVPSADQSTYLKHSPGAQLSFNSTEWSSGNECA